MQQIIRLGIVALFAIVTPSTPLSAAPSDSSAAAGAPAPVRITNFSPSFNAAGKPGAVEIPIVHYVQKGSYFKDLLFGPHLEVDFIGVTHVGSREYYSQLNSRLAQYDTVLFELVANKKQAQAFTQAGARTSRSSLQRAIGEYLGLSFQLDQINYSSPHFVHADISMTQLKDSLWNHRGPILVAFLRAILDESNSDDPRSKEHIESIKRELEGIDPFALILTGPTPEQQRRLRRIMALALTSSDSLFEKLDGVDKVLITERNTAALKVLKEQIDKGKRRIAIFYGTGHLPDMHRQLTQQFGLSVAETEWLTAWTL